MDDLLLFKQADQVCEPQTWFGLKISDRMNIKMEAFKKVFGKGFDEDWSSEMKYFTPGSPIDIYWNLK